MKSYWLESGGLSGDCLKSSLGRQGSKSRERKTYLSDLEGHGL